jgi:hypothetical protein
MANPLEKDLAGRLSHGVDGGRRDSSDSDPGPGPGPGEDCNSGHGNHFLGLVETMVDEEMIAARRPFSPSSPCSSSSSRPCPCPCP